MIVGPAPLTETAERFRVVTDATAAGPVAEQPHPSSALRTMCHASGGRDAPFGATRVNVACSAADDAIQLLQLIRAPGENDRTTG